MHFNFEKYKIWMQKFCRASFHQIHYKNNITKLVSKCAGRISEQLLLMFYRPGKNSKNLRGGGGGQLTTSRCNSAFSKLHIELLTTETLRGDVLSKIFLHAWIFSFD